MSPVTSVNLPSDLPLTIGASGEHYQTLNALLFARGYLNFLKIAQSDIFTEQTATALGYLRNHCGVAPLSELGGQMVEELSRQVCGQLPLTDDMISDALSGSDQITLVGNPWGPDVTMLSYRINKNSETGRYSQRLTDAEVESAIHKAFSWWCSDKLLLDFIKVDSLSAEVDIEITFFKAVDHHDGVDFHLIDGNRPILAHAYYPVKKFDAAQMGDIHFNDDIEWEVNVANGTGFDFTTVAAHEIGHSLGIGHDTSGERSIMVADYAGKFDELPDVDEAKFKRVYVEHGETTYSTTKFSDTRGGGTNPVRTTP